jgi:hypothetical protein
VTRLDEVHVLRRERHGFPVEAAFEQQLCFECFALGGPAGVGGTLEPGFEFAFETVELLGREVALARGVDERAGGLSFKDRETYWVAGPCWRSIRCSWAARHRSR